jgi:hypothetical protein
LRQALFSWVIKIKRGRLLGKIIEDDPETSESISPTRGVAVSYGRQAPSQHLHRAHKAGRWRASCETPISAPALESLLVHDPGRFERRRADGRPLRAISVQVELERPTVLSNQLGINFNTLKPGLDPGFLLNVKTMSQPPSIATRAPARLTRQGKSKDETASTDSTPTHPGRTQSAEKCGGWEGS